MDRSTLPTAITPGFRNPLTGHLVTPGKVLGHRKDGRPIHVIAGGSGEGDSGDSADSGDAGDDGDKADDTGDAKDGDGKGTPKIDGDFDADRARRAIAAARDAEKKAKGDAKTAKDQVAAILAAAGLKPDGTKDPAEQLKEASTKAEAAEAKARTTQIELAVYKAAGKASADPGALLDSRGFLSSVAELDPAAADFGDKVNAAIKAAVKANPKLAATSGGGAGKQGADHSGSGGSKSTSKDLASAVRKKLGG